MSGVREDMRSLNKRFTAKFVHPLFVIRISFFDSFKHYHHNDLSLSLSLKAHGVRAQGDAEGTERASERSGLNPFSVHVSISPSPLSHVSAAGGERAASAGRAHQELLRRRRHLCRRCFVLPVTPPASIKRSLFLSLESNNTSAPIKRSLYLP